MILGIGTDIVAVARIEAAIQRHGIAFAEYILSDSELAEYSEQKYQARFLAKRFAAKEALAKATGQGLRAPVTLRAISVTHDDLGKPILAFSEELAAHLAGLGMSSHHLSISDEKETVVAFVVLERN
jgi:holo-[acyl-carrier protein] synthase